MADALPSTVSYRPIRTSLFLRALLAAGFVSVALWVTWVGWTNGRAGLIAAAVMIGCSAYFAYIGTGYLSQLTDRQSLELDRDGFSYRFAWRRRRISWRDVSEFKVIRYRTMTGIGFDIPDAKSNWTRRINRDAIGVSEFMMPHTFDAPIQDVCDTLNAFRSRAIERS